MFSLPDFSLGLSALSTVDHESPRERSCSIHPRERTYSSLLLLPSNKTEHVTPSSPIKKRKSLTHSGMRKGLSLIKMSFNLDVVNEMKFISKILEKRRNMHNKKPLSSRKC
jgi:hypothetical protein